MGMPSVKAGSVAALLSTRSGDVHLQAPKRVEDLSGVECWLPWSLVGSPTLNDA